MREVNGAIVYAGSLVQGYGESMAQQECPSGLVVLATTNLLCAAIAAFGVMVVHELAPEQHFVLATGAAIALLLFASGVGYLAQKRLARLAGNAYAVVAVLALLRGDAPGPVALVAMVYALYPVATLLLVNGTFRRHLAR